MDENAQRIEAEQGPEAGIGELMQRMLIVSGTLSFEEVPRVQYMTRPAPTPEGKIAVMLRAFRNGYFLVDKNPECKGCGGDGLDKRKDASTHVSEIPYCPACVITEVQHFGKIWEGKLAEKREQSDAEERDERTDKALEKRLAEARAKVTELEHGKQEALGQNKIDAEAAKARIEELKAFSDRCGEQHEEQKTILKNRNREHAGMEEHARAVHAERTREANAELASSLSRIKQHRDEALAKHGEVVNKIAADYDASARERTKVEEELRRYEAGPAKIAKRWDEKIEPARKTLERLERRWKA